MPDNNITQICCKKKKQFSHPFINLVIREALERIVIAKLTADKDPDWKENEEKLSKELNEAFQYAEEVLSITEPITKKED